jgi:hypothetical protein
MGEENPDLPPRTWDCILDRVTATENMVAPTPAPCRGNQVDVSALIQPAFIAR